MKNSDFFLLTSQIWGVGSLNSDKHAGAMLAFCVATLLIGIALFMVEPKQKAPTEVGA